MYWNITAVDSGIFLKGRRSWGKHWPKLFRHPTGSVRVGVCRYVSVCVSVYRCVCQSQKQKRRHKTWDEYRERHPKPIDVLFLGSPETSRRRWRCWRARWLVSSRPQFSPRSGSRPAIYRNKIRQGENKISRFTWDDRRHETEETVTQRTAPRSSPAPS